MSKIITDQTDDFTSEMETMLADESKRTSLTDSIFGMLKGGALKTVATDLASSHKDAVAISLKANIGGIVLKNTVDLLLAMLPKSIASNIDSNPMYRGTVEFAAANLAAGALFFMARNSDKHAAKYQFAADSVIFAMQTRMFSIFNVEHIVDHMLSGVRGKLESAINGGTMPGDAVFDNNPANKPM